MADIKRIGVVGAGQMGAGIVQVAAQAGFDVTLRSRKIESARQCADAIANALSRLATKGKISQSDADGALARISVTDRLDELADCDLVIESVVEDLATKTELFKQLDRCCDDAILATNTSTLSVTEIAVATSRPESVVGIHFFNPAPVMSLIEIVRALTTDEAVAESAVAFAQACGKTPVEVADRAGFVVNALLFPYLNNAVMLLETGVADRDAIDAAMKGGCGFPMGPLATLDLVGLDTSVAILEALHAEYGDPLMRPHPRLKRMAAAGRLGRKSGVGFYDYR